MPATSEMRIAESGSTACTRTWFRKFRHKQTELCLLNCASARRKMRPLGPFRPLCPLPVMQQGEHWNEFIRHCGLALEPAGMQRSSPARFSHYWGLGGHAANDRNIDVDNSYERCRRS